MKNKQIILSCAATAVITAILTGFFYFSPLGITFVGGKIDSPMAKNFGKLMLIEKYIEDNYMGKYSPGIIADKAVHSYVKGLNDPYSAYFNSKEFEALSTQLGGEYKGIGVTVAPLEGRIVIAETAKDSPAKKAGIEAGDILLEVNGNEYNAETIDGATEAIKATKKGETVLLLIERDGREQEFTVTVDNISKNATEHQLLDGNIGYIYISSFVDGLGDEFKKALDDLESKGAKSLIIDLRNNPGGTLDSAVEVADILLGECTVVTVKNKAGNEEKYTSDKKETDLPIRVLINENSASASEVLSGALRDNKKATLVGKKTFGKGVVQSVVGFGDGSGLSLTIAKYYTPSGECINGIGINPDIDVDLPSGFEYTSGEVKKGDTQLEAAVNSLK